MVKCGFVNFIAFSVGYKVTFSGIKFLEKTFMGI